MRHAKQTSFPNWLREFMVVTDKDNYIVCSWSFGNLECAISQAVLTHEKNKEQKKKRRQG